MKTVKLEEIRRPKKGKIKNLWQLLRILDRIIPEFGIVGYDSGVDKDYILPVCVLIKKMFGLKVCYCEYKEAQYFNTYNEKYYFSISDFQFDCCKNKTIMRVELLKKPVEVLDDVALEEHIRKNETFYDKYNEIIELINIRIKQFETCKYNDRGYDLFGYDKFGYDEFGWNKYGRNKNGEKRYIDKSHDEICSRNQDEDPVCIQDDYYYLESNIDEEDEFDYGEKELVLYSDEEGETQYYYTDKTRKSIEEDYEINLDDMESDYYEDNSPDNYDDYYEGDYSSDYD